jgi:S1-C subfamily serine protease
MRRVLVPLIAAAALVLSACTAGSSPDVAEPQAVFPSPSRPAPATGQDAVEKVVDQVLPAVVNVVSQFGQGEGEGTGFVVRSDGIIVTNYHVVEGASKVTVLTSAKDPVRYEARVIGGDVEADLAVLDVDATDLPTVPLGNSDDLNLGQQVVAIGYALGLAGGPSVTSGVVSSLTRRITVPDANCQECPNRQRIYTEVVQTDAAINPGNSGGPLVDMAGQVVGINTAGANTAENIAFAIQIDAVKPTIFQAAENPSAPVAFMGITSADASDPSVQFELDPPVTKGAVIVGVVEGGPAADAGIRQGDVVVLFDDEPVDSANRLGELIRARKPGDEVSVGLVHPDGSREVVTVVLGVNPVATA